MSRLANDWVKGVRVAVAERDDCTAAVLARLAVDGDRVVRARAAGNVACPAVSVAGLALDRDRDVRVAVAGNPVCRAAPLVRLAGDEHTVVRRAAAGNPNLTDCEFVGGSLPTPTKTSGPGCGPPIRRCVAADGVQEPGGRAAGLAQLPGVPRV